LELFGDQGQQAEIISVFALIKSEIHRWVEDSRQRFKEADQLSGVDFSQGSLKLQGSSL